MPNMTFNWVCPDCSINHYYSGSQTTRATTNCPKTKKKYKVWQHKVVVRLNPPKVETSSMGLVHAEYPNRSADDVGVIDSETFMGIDFNRIADLSSFRMFIQEVIKTSLPGFEGVPTRGKKKVITKAFNKRILYWKEVQEEMKEVLKKRRENEI